MRIKALFISAVMAIAVVTGICKGLRSPRSREKKDDGEKEAEKGTLKAAE